jgi:threonine/homoserine/homoserine lactone efflux protein
VFDALRITGAAYLAYLGYKTWRAPVADEVNQLAETRSSPGQSATQFRQGFLVAASNPKAILFAAAFFPQFINPQLAKLPQFGILLVTFAVIEISWYFVYAVSGKRLSAYLRRATIMRTFNRVTGGVFIGFAAVMATARD